MPDMTPERSMHSLLTDANYWERAGKPATAEECISIAMFIEQLTAENQRRREESSMHTLAQIERRIIEARLRRLDRNVTHTARSLGISVRTLQRRMRRYNLLYAPMINQHTQSR